MERFSSNLVNAKIFQYAKNRKGAGGHQGTHGSLQVMGFSSCKAKSSLSPFAFIAAQLRGWSQLLASATVAAKASPRAAQRAAEEGCADALRKRRIPYCLLWPVK